MKLLHDDTGLFVRLYRLAHRQQENFTTEAFVHTLREIAVTEPALAVRLLDWLTDSTMFSSRSNGSPLVIRSQAYTEEHGIPDIRIEADDLDVIIEVKLDAGLTYGQANAYARQLEERGADRTALVALVGSPPLNELPPRTTVRTWGELGQWLLREEENSKNPVASYLADEFIALLNHLHLMPLAVRTRLSESLAKHRDWANANPDKDSITRTPRIGSFSRFDEMEHAEPMKNLLLQMDHVLRHHPEVGSYRLDSGPIGPEPWIGFNIEALRYFFFVDLDHPEKVILDRYKDPVDPASFDLALGHLVQPNSAGLTGWRAILDLADPNVGYFEASEADQVRLLEEFFRQGFAYARQLRSPKDFL